MSPEQKTALILKIFPDARCYKAEFVVIALPNDSASCRVVDSRSNNVSYAVLPKSPSEMIEQLSKPGEVERLREHIARIRYQPKSAAMR